jgi:phosphotransferase system HPr (HPr) family protein
MIAHPAAPIESLPKYAESPAASLSSLSSSTSCRIIKVVNPHGLHLRSCSKIVEAMKGFEADVTVAKGNHVAIAESVLDLMLLGAAMGAELELTAAGADAEQAITALADLLAGDFD